MNIPVATIPSDWSFVIQNDLAAVGVATSGALRSGIRLNDAWACRKVVLRQPTNALAAAVMVSRSSKLELRHRWLCNNP